MFRVLQQGNCSFVWAEWAVYGRILENRVISLNHLMDIVLNLAVWQKEISAAGSRHGVQHFTDPQLLPSFVRDLQEACRECSDSQHRRTQPGYDMGCDDTGQRGCMLQVGGLLAWCPARLRARLRKTSIHISGGFTGWQSLKALSAR